MKLNIQLFASGTIAKTSAPPNGNIQVVWSSVPSGSAENYSTVTAYVQVKRNSSGKTYGTFSGNIQIHNSSSPVSKKFSPLQDEWATVGTYTRTVQHNSDGTMTCIIGAYLEQTGTSLAGDYEASATITLDTINRISPVSTATDSVNMGSNINIYTNRYVNTFTHTLRYKFGSDTGTIATGVSSSNTWSVPLTLANQIPNATSGICTIYCDTYNGSTYIGTSSCEITLNVPSSVVPTASFTLARGGDTSLNAWVQNKSQAIINITASGSYGSSITSYTTTVGNYYYSGNTVTTRPINTFGNTLVKVEATDSRNRKTTITQTIYIEPYSMPTISSAQVQRCNIDGTLNDNGDYCYYVFNGSISSVNSLNKTNTTYKIGYKLSTDANYTYITIDSNKDSITSSGVLSSSGSEIQFNSSNNYDINFEIEDTYSTSQNTIQLTSGFDIMNLNSSGKSIAFGEVSQRGANEKCMDIALDTYVNGARIGRIARVQLTSDSPEMLITNLNLESGRAYRVIIAEYAKSQAAHYLKINGISGNSKGTNAIYDKTYNSISKTQISTTSGIAITNTGDLGANIFYTDVTINYFDKNNIHCCGMTSGGHLSSGTIMISQVGSTTEQNISAITTIGVYAGVSPNIGSGSYIEIWG